MRVFLRNETYPNEFRSPLTPQDMAFLAKKGFHFILQRSQHRIFTDEEFQDISGIVLTENEWFDPEFQSCLILGIKELPFLEKLHGHTHCYFSHSFKQQTNANKILSTFLTTKSILHDLEYFLDSSGHRLIAFGFHAGLVGATLGLQQYRLAKSGNSLQPLKTWNSFETMLDSIQILPHDMPNILVLGSKGRCGSGVCTVLEKLGIPYSTINKGDPLVHFYDYDLVFNCILLDPSYSQVWFSTESIPTCLEKPIVIVDISCDLSKPNNPIQLYTEPTTWEKPVYTPHEKIHIIAIENLPSLLPKESSIHFSQQFTKLLLENDEDVWESNKNYFLNHARLYN